MFHSVSKEKENLKFKNKNRDYHVQHKSSLAGLQCRDEAQVRCVN